MVIMAVIEVVIAMVMVTPLHGKFCFCFEFRHLSYSAGSLFLIGCFLFIRYETETRCDWLISFKWPVVIATI